MQSKASTVKEYLEQLSPDRKEAMLRLRNEILSNLPQGFSEEMSYGMIGYVIPHSLYPEGYHCNPKLPLPFMNIASQKNFIALYHMGLYANENLMDWFKKELAKRSASKPDMGKSCLRFNKPENIPYELIGALAGKVTPQEWIEWYKKFVKR